MKQETSSKSRDIFLSWVVGAAIVLPLAVAREQGVAPRLIRTLLWPGFRLAHATGHSGHDLGIVLIIACDSILYGFLFFFVLRILRTILK